jgi:hypothetical protein
MSPPRYSYLMCSDATTPSLPSSLRQQRIPYRDIVKVDAIDGRRWVWHSYGVVGEPLFIPRSPSSSSSLSLASSSRASSASSSRHSSPQMMASSMSGHISGEMKAIEEDDGWVYVQVYIPETHITDIVILDARHIQNGPICRIKLKHHLPYAFHACWAPFSPNWLYGQRATNPMAAASNNSNNVPFSLGSMITPHALTPLVLPHLNINGSSSSGHGSGSSHGRRSPPLAATPCVIM